MLPESVFDSNLLNLVEAHCYGIQKRVGARIEQSRSSLNGW